MDRRGKWVYGGYFEFVWLVCDYNSIVGNK